MTTNRMGLEQTLSDERLEEVANIGSVDQMAFPPSHAQCADMARELLAYRKRSRIRWPIWLAIITYYMPLILKCMNTAARPLPSTQHHHSRL